MSCVEREEKKRGREVSDLRLIEREREGERERGK